MWWQKNVGGDASDHFHLIYVATQCLTRVTVMLVSMFVSIQRESVFPTESVAQCWQCGIVSFSLKHHHQRCGLRHRLWENQDVQLRCGTELSNTWCRVGGQSKCSAAQGQSRQVRTPSGGCSTLNELLTFCSQKRPYRSHEPQQHLHFLN